MGKLDDLRRTMGGNVAESASRREAAPTPTLASLASARTAGVARSKNALEIPVERIAPDPDQPREEFDQAALERLAVSLKARGQLQPVRVRWDEGRGTYVLICGERRWRAAAMAGLTSLSCVVSDEPLDAGGVLAAQLVENCVREDLAPIEQARAFRALMERMGWSGNRLAQELGINQSGVVHALALLELPPDVQERVERGALPASTAYEIGKAGDTETIRAVAEEVVASGLSRAEAVERVRRAAGGKRPGKAKGRGATSIKSRVFRTPTGRVTVDLRKAGDGDAILAALEDAVRQAKAERGGSAEAA